MASAVLDTDLLDSIRRGGDSARSDIELAAALARLVHNELEVYGTDGSQRTNDGEIRLAIRTLKVLLGRIGLSASVPFSDFGAFRSYWMANDGYGSWQARRDILNEVFERAHTQACRARRC